MKDLEFVDSVVLQFARAQDNIAGKVWWHKVHALVTPSKNQDMVENRKGFYKLFKTRSNWLNEDSWEMPYCKFSAAPASSKRSENDREWGLGMSGYERSV